MLAKPLIRLRKIDPYKGKQIIYKMRKIVKSYRDLDYNEVVDYGEKMGLSTNSHEDLREVAIAMFNEKYAKKKEVVKEYPELFSIVAELRNKIAVDINTKVLKVQSSMPYKAQYVLEELIKELKKMV